MIANRRSDKAFPVVISLLNRRQKIVEQFCRFQRVPIGSKAKVLNALHMRLPQHSFVEVQEKDVNIALVGRLIEVVLSEYSDSPVMPGCKTKGGNLSMTILIIMLTNMCDATYCSEISINQSV